MVHTAWRRLLGRPAGPPLLLKEERDRQTLSRHQTPGSAAPQKDTIPEQREDDEVKG